MRLKVFDPKKNKDVVCGDVIKDTYVRKVTKRHLMIKMDAYAIQESVIKRLIELKIKLVKLIAPDGEYVSTLQDWLAPNIKVLDYGHGKQRFLPRRYMSKFKK